MASFHLSWSLDNQTGTTGYKVKYRISGTSAWTSFLTSGMTATISQIANNTIFDIEIQNLNNFDNAISPIARAIGITDPNPLFSPTNSTIAFSFANLSDFIDSYTCTIALASAPGSILQTLELSAIPTVVGTFTGLDNLTVYRVSVTPVADEFTSTFTYDITTAESATCAIPSSVYALMTSGSTIMSIHWISSAIVPADGFKISYRKKGEGSYTSFLTSGTTSGNTAVISATPASYEGYIQSVCIDDTSMSEQVPFGTNGYQPIWISISVRSNPLNYIANIYSNQSNPYDTIVSGTFSINASPFSISYDALYPADSVNADIVLSAIPPSAVVIVSEVVITAISSQFDNGGTLQQFDSLLTPPYFAFITSGHTWDGNPSALPSFTLDEFTVTEYDTNGNVLAGILAFSWIYDDLYGDGDSPYNTVTFKMIDPSNSSVMGAITTSASPLGARNSSIAITKQVTAISSDNLFTLTTYWSDTSTISSRSFYLPLF